MAWPCRLLPVALLAALSICRTSSAQPVATPPAETGVCFRCIRSDMEFLSSDELRGRGSGTRDEHVAALFAASLFEDFGLQPGGDRGSFFEKAPLPNPLPRKVVNQLKGFSPEPRRETWNVVAVLRGSDPTMNQEAILLTAHLDHLGLGPAKNGDVIYNGADDDASGTTAVIELARSLSHGQRPKRTILFVLFGSEEIGGFGNRYFLTHAPLPLRRIMVNLEFEMIGRPDPAAPHGYLWLTGFSRSNLGPELVRHGAPLVADPHLKQKFFERSDNYSLARRGIIAQTISSFGLHADYHQPSDEIGRIDFAHMDSAIAAMEKPIDWLANTEWKPHWRKGGRPE